MPECTTGQAAMRIPTTDLSVSPGHVFSARLNAFLEEAGIDRFAEEQSRPFDAAVTDWSGLPQAWDLRLLLLEPRCSAHVQTPHAAQAARSPFGPRVLDSASARLATRVWMAAMRLGRGFRSLGLWTAVRAC